MLAAIIAIISIVLGNFLIGLLFKPTLDRLREIREELLDIASSSLEMPLRAAARESVRPGTIRKMRQSCRPISNYCFMFGIIFLRCFEISSRRSAIGSCCSWH
jgi:hypothetical protein